MTSARLWAGHQPLTPSPDTYKCTANMGVKRSTHQLSSGRGWTPLQPGLSHDVNLLYIFSHHSARHWPSNHAQRELEMSRSGMLQCQSQNRYSQACHVYPSVGMIACALRRMGKRLTSSCEWHCLAGSRTASPCGAAPLGSHLSATRWALHRAQGAGSSEAPLNPAVHRLRIQLTAQHML